MNTLSYNIVANLAGRAWASILGVLFIPVYLRFLGIEAYGLVGFLATLQSVFGILDMGLSATLNRELARLCLRENNVDEQRCLVRTLEIIYWLGSLLIVIVVSFLATSIRRYWLQPQDLSAVAVESAVRLMGIVTALQFPFSLYQGGLMGLQRQVLLNSVLVVTGTLRGLGAVLVLWLVSASIQAFFVWQIVMSALQTATVGVLLWRTLSPSAERPRFRLDLLTGIRRFAAGVSGNAVIGLCVTQLDKVLLSKLLTLTQFGYYSLSGSVAALLWNIIIPINQAIYPRFAQLYELHDDAPLADLYHRACQVMAVVLLPLAVTAALFPRELILLWTWNSEVADNTYLLVSLLIIGTTFNGLASVPGYLQSAAGWPQLVMYTNLVSAILLVPAIIFMATTYGAHGAAVVWVILNAGYFFFTVPVMHRRLLRAEKRNWYVQDVGFPLGGVLAVGGLFRLCAPDTASMLYGGVLLFGCWAVSQLVCLLLSSHARAYLRARMSKVGAAYGF